jgi:hypothetical protein
LDYNTFENKKICSQFDFPNILDLRPYSAKDILKNDDIKKLAGQTSSDIDFEALMAK